MDDRRFESELDDEMTSEVIADEEAEEREEASCTGSDESEEADEEASEVGAESDDSEESAESGEAVSVAAPAVSRKVRRRSRRTRPRSKTIAMKRLTREELRLGALLNPPIDEPRPTMRSECENDIRPCPWVACKHHLYLDVNPETGSIKINFPDLEPWEMNETCALDVADRSGITLEEVGEIMNLTRERIRQVEVRGLLKLKMATALEGFDGAAPLHQGAGRFDD